MSDKRYIPERRSRFRARLTALRWGAAALVVAAAHAGIVWMALNRREAEAAPSEPPPAVMIDLAPLAVAPPAPRQDVAPGPQQTEAEPTPTPDTPMPVAAVTPEPTPPAPPVAEATPEPAPPVPPPQVKIPDLPKKDRADAVLAPPPPSKPKTPRKPPPKSAAAERKMPIRPDRKRIRQTTAPPSSEARRSDDAAAPAAGASFQASLSPASWKGDLLAHLNRYKRYPPGASGIGTASVSFTINRSGQVLSSRLIGSSGDSVLDEEAALLPRRASPVPPPPAGVGGSLITLNVPIRFNR